MNEAGVALSRALPVSMLAGSWFARTDLPLADRELAVAALIEAYALERRRALSNTLQGIASCATACECCRMHQRIANAALEGAIKSRQADEEHGNCAQGIRA
jgi:hypothetical protein